MGAAGAVFHIAAARHSRLDELFPAINARAALAASHVAITRPFSRTHFIYTGSFWSTMYTPHYTQTHGNVTSL